ncbi:1727_t:CDS:2 [Funneliformis geosporum]|uniref:1727_t:CDS:1 n=1 Tax=Funneliformis geosporum TaxID=1117311 RepID=A0A9W4SLR6_9GLOM|nr:1727_t:CDS:2 [Funneliformis geosporum]
MKPQLPKLKKGQKQSDASDDDIVKDLKTQPLESLLSDLALYKGDEIEVLTKEEPTLSLTNLDKNEWGVIKQKVFADLYGSWENTAEEGQIVNLSEKISADSEDLVVSEADIDKTAFSPSAKQQAKWKLQEKKIELMPETTDQTNPADYTMALMFAESFGKTVAQEMLPKVIAAITKDTMEGYRNLDQEWGQNLVEDDGTYLKGIRGAAKFEQIEKQQQKNYENKKNSEAVKEIKVKEGTELKGGLEIKDYPDLEAIFLPFTKEITTLTIGSCPKIEVIFVPGNKITKIEGLKDLTQLRELNFGENQVEEIDVSNNNILEDLSLHKNPKTFKFTGDTLPIANILEGLSENDLKEVADKLGVKTENKPKEDIKKEIIAEIEKNNQNKEKLKDPKTGIPDLLNENGEIDKDKLEKLKDDAKKYEALVAEPKNDPVKSAGKKDIEQAELTKLIEAVEKIKNVLGVSPNNPLPNDWENKLDDLKNRPTRDDLNNAVKNAEEKYKDYINPNSPGDKNKLEQAAKDAGFINPADSSALEKAANGQGKTVISQTDLNNLRNNQEKHKPEDLEKHKPGDLKPVDLPAN